MLFCNNLILVYYFICATTSFLINHYTAIIILNQTSSPYNLYSSEEKCILFIVTSIHDLLFPESNVSLYTEDGSR